MALGPGGSGIHAGVAESALHQEGSPLPSSPSHTVLGHSAHLPCRQPGVAMEIRPLSLSLYPALHLTPASLSPARQDWKDEGHEHHPLAAPPLRQVTIHTYTPSHGCPTAVPKKKGGWLWAQGGQGTGTLMMDSWEVRGTGPGQDRTRQAQGSLLPSPHWLPEHNGRSGFREGSRPLARPSLLSQLPVPRAWLWRHTPYSAPNLIPTHLRLPGRRRGRLCCGSSGDTSLWTGRIGKSQDQP